MKSRRPKFSLLYQEALQAHLDQGRKAVLESAAGLGVQALAGGLQTLDLANLHEKTLVDDLLPGLSGRGTGRHHQAGGVVLRRGDQSDRIG